MRSLSHTFYPSLCCSVLVVASTSLALAQGAESAVTPAVGVESVPAPVEESTASSASAAPTGEIIQLDTMTVIGSKMNVERLPGSGAYIEAEEFTAFAYDDLNQALRRTPGVYVRPEDGYGLFPNVSLRGVSTTRNSKITVMEDGILMAPAPYAAPAAYYTPTTGRMSGVEVLKGSSQIQYGPETTGGVINYLSTPIPQETGGVLKASYGSDNDIRLHAWYGGVFTGELVDVGYVVENYYREVDGFKTIDGTAGTYTGGKQTGFDRNDPMVKLRFDLKVGAPQSIEFKYGRTDLESDETYLGLTTEDFRDDPHRRYAASRFDHITTEQERLSVRYRIAPTDDLNFSVTAYQNEFARSWYKLQDVNGGGGNVNPAVALAGGDAAALAVLRGTGAGSFRVRDNNRAYDAEGIEFAGQWTFDIGSFEHELRSAVRFHRDEEFRFQRQDTYLQDANGNTTVVLPRPAAGTQENRIGEAEAVAFYVQDEISAGRLTVTPGVRYETISYSTENFLAGTPERTRDIDYIAPGVGATFEQTERVTWLAGAYMGVSPPGPGGATGGDQLNEETSIGFEVGVRYNNRTDFSAELIAFHTAFDDLIVEDNIGGGGGGDTTNVGRVDSSGIELALAYDPSVSRGWAIRNPWHLSFTYTHARLANDVNGSDVESIFAGGRDGAEVPYVPEYQISLGTGLEFGDWGVYADTYFQPRTFATANNVTTETNSQGDPDARFGTTDAYFLLDLALHYRLSDSATLKLTANNALDREYIASRVPVGPRPGAPRTLTAGIEVKF